MLFSHVLFCVKKTYIQGRWAPWSTDLPARITFTVIKSITKCLLTLIVLLTMYFNWNILIYIMSMVMSIKQLITLKTGKLITNIYLRKSSSTNWCFTYSITGSRLPCGSHIVKLSYLKTKKHGNNTSRRTVVQTTGSEDGPRIYTLQSLRIRYNVLSV